MGSRTSKYQLPSCNTNEVLHLKQSDGDINAESFFTASQACRVSGAAKLWPCSCWDEQWLQSTLGDHIVQISYKDACGNEVRREKEQLRSLLSKFSEQDENITAASDRIVPYIDNFDIFSLAPDLRIDVPSEKLFGPERELVIYGGFLGPAGSVTRIHFDSEDNIITCIFGRKLFVVAPPNSTLDYAARDIPLENPWSPDIKAAVKKHPLFAKCPNSVQAVILEPGDVFIQPKGWHHWVHNLSLALSVPCWAKILPSMD
mmetsp:Transcript_152872/g.292783  ORF Transcript_152872/g.292783 Transcript_152872/m.292783 type:complete len:259 (-) Transcript_152872:25-801(-)